LAQGALTHQAAYDVHRATIYGRHRTIHLKLGARYYNPTTGRFTQPDPAAKNPTPTTTPVTTPPTTPTPAALIRLVESTAFSVPLLLSNRRHSYSRE
jgi:hypothetical protein